jgi:hypothetical protein
MTNQISDPHQLARRAASQCYIAALISAAMGIFAIWTRLRGLKGSEPVPFDPMLMTCIFYIVPAIVYLFGAGMIRCGKHGLGTTIVVLVVAAMQMLLLLGLIGIFAIIWLNFGPPDVVMMFAPVLSLLLIAALISLGVYLLRLSRRRNDDQVRGFPL